MINKVPLDKCWSLPFTKFISLFFHPLFLTFLLIASSYNFSTFDVSRYLAYRDIGSIPITSISLRSFFIIGIKTLAKNVSLLLLGEYNSVGECPVTREIFKAHFIWRYIIRIAKKGDIIKIKLIFIEQVLLIKDKNAHLTCRVFTYFHFHLSLVKQVLRPFKMK
jgi:hypothetical protein